MTSTRYEKGLVGMDVDMVMYYISYDVLFCINREGGNGGGRGKGETQELEEVLNLLMLIFNIMD